MAITRAQQVRQMYKRGTGLGGNRGPQGPAGGASAGGNYGGNSSGGVSANNMSGANTSGRAGDGSGFSQFERRQRQNAQLQGAGFLGKDLGMNIGEQDRLAKFGDFVKSGGITGNILSSLFSGNTGTTRPPTTFVGGGGDDLQMQSIPLWAQLGFNNETEYLASLEEENNTDQETTEDDTILKRRFAAEGGIMNSDVVGGEMDFDSARQMYGLGKLVKKITRSVKKIAKSPIGKAALLYTGLGGLGSLAQGGSFFTNFANPLSQIKSVGSIFAKGGLDNIMARTGLGKFVEAGPGKAVLEKNFLGKALTSPTALISAGSAIAGMLTPEQEEEAQTIADNTGIDIAEIRANPNKYLARRFRAEGGSMDEPVAKKTMPLLDMDGQEMDLRAEGGFVPIGRMEKADDVPARLSKNEFVFTAEAVRNAGEGDVDKGAEVMYNMMKNLESGGEVSEESQGLEGAREMFQTSQRLEEVI
jgi:hypothetical protein